MMTREFLLAALLAFSPASGFAATGDPGVRVVVPTHDIPRGQTIAESDLTYATVPGNALIAGVITDFSAAREMQARRLLHAGEVFRSDDVRKPIVVTKGQIVTMMFSAPGVELTAMGRAVSEGGIGDTVMIENPASFRMVSGVITAPGTVVASGPASPTQRTARN